MSIINDFFNIVILSVGNYNLQIKQAVLAMVVFFVSIALILFVTRYLKKERLSKWINPKNLKSLIRFVRLLILIVSGIMIIQILGFNIKSILQYELLHTSKISFSLYNIITLLIIFFITKLVLHIIELAFDDNIKSKKIEKGKGQSLFQIVKYVIWVLATTLFLDSIGFSITFMIASLSALMVGLGLGIQHFFNDIVSGIVILFDRSIKVNDIVEIQGEIVGKVVEISLRTSKIISRDDVIIIIPNSKFTADNVINWSHNSFKTRFGVKVGVAYGSNVEKVKQLLIDAANEHPEIDSKPAPHVYFRDFGNSSLDFELLFMTDESFRVERIKSDLRFAINKKFSENGVTIPFPQSDVHLYQS